VVKDLDQAGKVTPKIQMKDLEVDLEVDLKVNTTKVLDLKAKMKMMKSKMKMKMKIRKAMENLKYKVLMIK
jgi:hypothetical protein